MSCLDQLLPFIDNGGRRLYVERRRDEVIAERESKAKSKAPRGSPGGYFIEIYSGLKLRYCIFSSL